MRHVCKLLYSIYFTYILARTNRGLYEQPAVQRASKDILKRFHVQRTSTELAIVRLVFAVVFSLPSMIFSAADDYILEGQGG